MRKTQIKATMRHHSATIRMTITPKKENKHWRGCGETGILYAVGENVK